MRPAGIAAIACCAVITDTSCSTERLPKKTPTFTGSGMSDSRLRTKQDDLALQVDIESAQHRVVRDLDEREHVGSSRVIHVDDEVGVLWRDLRAADTVSFQPGCLDEAPCLVARRVLEHAPEAANAIRL